MSSFRSNILALNPTICLPLFEQSGNFADLGSAGAVGTPTWGTSSSPYGYGQRNFRPGRGSLGVALQKTSDTVFDTISLGNQCAFDARTQGMSLAMFVKIMPSSASPDVARIICGRCQGSGANQGWSVLNNAALQIKSNNGEVLKATPSRSFPTNVWILYEATYDGTNKADATSIQIRMDGELQTCTYTNVPHTASMSNATVARIGGGGSSAIYGTPMIVSWWAWTLGAIDLSGLKAKFPTYNPVVQEATQRDAWNGLCYLGNAKVLCVWRSGTTHASDWGALRGKISTDGGVTWPAGSGSLIYQDANNRINSGDSSVVKLADGRLALNFFRTNLDTSAVIDTLVMFSSDGGATWSAPTAVVAGRATAGRILQDGANLYCPSYDGTNAYLHKSTDNGATWPTSIKVFDGVADTRTYTEMTVLKLISGKYYAICRNDAGGVYYKTSNSLDSGWSAAALAYTPAGAVDAPRTIQIPFRFTGGTAGRLYSQNRSASTSGEIWISDDEGATWTKSFTFDIGGAPAHGDFAWNPDDNVLLYASGADTANVALRIQTIGDFLASPVTVDPTGAVDFIDRLTAYNQIANEYGPYTINRYAGDGVPVNAATTLGANLTTVTDQVYDPSVQHKNKYPDSLTGYAYSSHDLTITTTSNQTVLKIDGDLHQGKLIVIPAGAFTLTNHVNHGANAGVKVDGSASGGGAILQQWSGVSINILAGGSVTEGLLITGSVQIQGNVDHVTVRSANTGAGFRGIKADHAAGNVVFKDCASIMAAGTSGMAWALTGLVSGSDYNASSGSDDIGEGTHNVMDQTTANFVSATDLHLVRNSPLRKAGYAGTYIGAFGFTGKTVKQQGIDPILSGL